MILDVVHSQERAQLDGLNQFDGALTRLWEVRSGKCLTRTEIARGRGGGTLGVANKMG